MTTNYYNILPTNNVGFCGKDNCVYDIHYDRYARRIVSIVERNKNKIMSQEEIEENFKQGCITGLSVWEILKLIRTNNDVRNYYNFSRKVQEYKKSINLK